MTKENIYFNVPLDFLLANEQLVEQFPVNVEIFVDGEHLDMLTPELTAHVRDIFEKRGLKRRVHGPYSEMFLGAFDPRIRKVTLDRFTQALDFAERIGAASMTLHSGYDTLNKRFLEERYFENVASSLKLLGGLAEEKGKMLVLENTFEQDPELLVRAVQGADSPNLGLCFDVAHHHVFAAHPLCEWIGKCAPFIKEVHLTDNNGAWDEHLAPGNGNIDFKTFFGALEENAVEPAFTFEPHDVDQLKGSLRFIHLHPEYFG